MTEGDKEAAPAVAPFLSKCYDMVDDPATDGTVSWGKDGTSFVVWDPHAFSRDLLPKYFKHSNLSSFVRQLNTYGFHKADHDRWEFANKGFLRGQKHSLKTIIRRKPAQSHPHLQSQQSQAPNISVSACVEVGKFGLEEELERLKRDRDLLRQELVKLRQHQQNTDKQLHELRQRLQEMEQNQQQMLSFLAMAVQSPGFLPQLLRQNGNSWQQTEMNKKRRLPALENGGMDEVDVPSDSQIVRYQPSVTETLKPLLIPMPSPDASEPMYNGIDGLSTTPDASEPVHNGIDGLCTTVDDMSLGSDSILPSERNVLQSEFLSNYFEELLASPKPDKNRQGDPHNLESSDFILDYDLLDEDFQMDTIQNVDSQGQNGQSTI